jgi:predicted tellurium resistance membrane protein TerC
MDFSSQKTLIVMTFIDLLSSPNTWVALLTLTFLEIVLGIDNIVFISIVSNKLSASDQPKARNIGLMLAMLFRILLLFGIKAVLSLNQSFLDFDWGFAKGGVTGQALIIFSGGLFLLYKSVKEIHHKLEDDDENIGAKSNKVSLKSAIIQIALLNLVFSFDSILTAVGLVSFDEYGSFGAMCIMITSVVISILIMMVFAGPVSQFVNRHPSIQILGLSFLILIGVMLLAEASHLSNVIFLGEEVHSLPKGYLYFAIFFSLGIEFLNIKLRKNKGKPVELHNSDTVDKF